MKKLTTVLNRKVKTNIRFKEGVMKKLTSISIILMFALFMFGAATNSFAGPPADKASKNQACNNASDNGKAHANGNSVLSDCGGEEPPPEDPPADEPPADPCLDPDYFNTHFECWGF